MRVYKLKLALGFFLFVLFEVGAEQVPLRKIRETTLYRADVFFSSLPPPSLPLALPRSLGRSVRAGVGLQKLQRLGQEGWMEREKKKERERGGK